ITAMRFDPGTETRFSRLDADLRFTKGQGQINKLDLVSPVVRVSQGKPASVDLVNRQMDVVVNLRVSDNANRDLRALRGVKVPMRVTGSFDNLSYQVQWQDIAGAAVRGAVKSGLLELLGNQLENSIQAPAAPDSSTPAPAAPAPAKDPVRSIGDALKGLLGQ
ncbi:MAG: hypothetical protein GX772_03930, partial [Alcaligenaceae bacterium]|nr:hypothetical protein [Alcaligenaceae bacterium]